VSGPLLASGDFAVLVPARGPFFLVQALAKGGMKSFSWCCVGKELGVM
jgi:hypothetical protein